MPYNRTKVPDVSISTSVFWKRTTATRMPSVKTPKAASSASVMKDSLAMASFAGKSTSVLTFNLLIIQSFSSFKASVMKNSQASTISMSYLVPI